MEYLGESPRLLLFNKVNNTIYHYSFPEGRLLNKTLLNITGPNGLGPLMNAGCALVPTGIVIFSHDAGRLFYLDWKGNIIDRQEINESNAVVGENITLPEVTNGHQIWPVKEGVVMSGAAGDVDVYTRINTLLLMQEKENVLMQPYTEIYERGIYGLAHLYSTSIARKSEDLFYQSFPLSNWVYLFNVKTGVKIDSIFMPSEYFNIDEIKPLGPRSQRRSSQAYLFEAAQYDFTTPYFMKIMVDKQRGNVLRLAMAKPTTPSSIKENGGQMWKGIQYSIIVTDSQGKALGEFLLPIDIYSVMFSFADNGKLYLLPSPIHQHDESHIKLHIVDYLKSIDVDHEN